MQLVYTLNYIFKYALKFIYGFQCIPVYLKIIRSFACFCPYFHVLYCIIHQKHLRWYVSFQKKSESGLSNRSSHAFVNQRHGFDLRLLMTLVASSHSFKVPCAKLAEEQTLLRDSVPCHLDVNFLAPLFKRLRSAVLKIIKALALAPVVPDTSV